MNTFAWLNGIPLSWRWACATLAVALTAQVLAREPEPRYQPVTLLPFIEPIDDAESDNPLYRIPPQRLEPVRVPVNVVPQTPSHDRVGISFPERRILPATTSLTPNRSSIDTSRRPRHEHGHTLRKSNDVSTRLAWLSELDPPEEIPAPPTFLEPVPQPAPVTEPAPVPLADVLHGTPQQRPVTEFGCLNGLPCDASAR